MPLSYYLNEDKSVSPCNLYQWAKQQHLEIPHIGCDIVNDKVVSTIWLGINHNWDDSDSNPLIFETVVFDKDANSFHQERYSTYAEALKGHQDAIQWVKDKFEQE